MRYLFEFALALAWAGAAALLVARARVLAGAAAFVLVAAILVLRHAHAGGVGGAAAGSAAAPARAFAGAGPTASCAHPGQPVPDPQRGSFDTLMPAEYGQPALTAQPRVARGEVIVAGGWAAQAAVNAPAVHPCIFVDGRPVPQRLEAGISRPDVSAAFNEPPLGESGFRITLQTGGLAPGPHRLELAVLLDAAHHALIPVGARQITILP